MNRLELDGLTQRLRAAMASVEPPPGQQFARERSGWTQASNAAEAVLAELVAEVSQGTGAPTVVVALTVPIGGVMGGMEVGRMADLARRIVDETSAKIKEAYDNLTG